jgi:ABC-type multidrug transport system fused ATPase/permease subunit
MHSPAAEASKLVKPFTLFVVLVVARFVMDGAMWFCSCHTRSPMLVRIKEEVFAYAQRLSSAYFENTLSGKIAHRAVLLPDQVLALFDMMVFDFVPGACFFLFVAAYFYITHLVSTRILPVRKIGPPINTALQLGVGSSAKSRAFISQSRRQRLVICLPSLMTRKQSSVRW